MSSFSHLSNEELRQELNKNGIAYGPILANTRKVYEKKLQNMLEGKVDGNVQNGVEENVTTNGNGTMNGNGNARTPSRETSPNVVELTPHQQSRETTPAKRMRETTPQATNNEEDSDDEEDASENARVLTPEEMRSFHSGLMRRYSESPSTNLRQRREKSSVQPMNGINNGIAATNPTNKSSAGSNKFMRYVMPILVILVLVGMIASAYYFRDRIPAMMKALPDVFNRQQPQQKKMPMPPTTTKTMQE